eukprot:CAMPEP_0185747882 /NCGR_PEP_ID=MMETSP1174-20130828/6522_1 /TAXON_ID=35687 /ORGANISM="Dictyocha speculum, Strain CCMP1381" /LENGTH=463 /DNA_ID=CAMNT_0028423277 /DNA_START=89 /DNA_END=1476 /DNA_ORIENTATION=-
MSTRKSGPIRFKTSFRNTIYEALLERGWKETSGDDWDIHWADRDWIYEVFDTMQLQSWQRVNHYRNDRELCRKDLLVKNLKKFKRSLQRTNPEEAQAYDFWPTTFVLPGEYAIFAEEFKRNPNSRWIMKPVGRSQGKGIFIFQKISQISKWRQDNSRHKKLKSREVRDSSKGRSSKASNKSKQRINSDDGSDNKSETDVADSDAEKPTKADDKKSKKGGGGKEEEDAETYVVQKYVSNPFLVAGRKFDMRIYALVTSYSPLTVWLYRSGFCRFSSTRYSNAAADLENVFMHLTNVAIQKKSDNYASSNGGKWDIRHLKLHLMSRYGVEVADRVYHEIQMIVIRSLLSVQQVMIQDKHCVELYGYDVLIDDKFKAWLVEVNASPSLTANTADDHALKLEMLRSVIDIMDMDRIMKGNETRVGGFDLIYKSCNVPPHDEPSSYSSMLGGEIPEHEYIRRTMTVGG